MLEWILYHFTYIFNVNVLLILVGIYLFYKLGTVRYNLHLKLGHKGPTPLPYLGNFLDTLRVGVHETDLKNYQKYGKIYPFYMGSFKFCMVTDEELLKQILIKEYKSFTGKADIGLINDATDKMLLFLEDKEWERMRSLISPAFTPGKLKKMMPMMSEIMDVFERRILNHNVGETIDFKEVFGALALDMIAQTMFGMKVDSQTNPNNRFMIYGKRLSTASTIVPSASIFYMCPTLFKMLCKFVPSTNFIDSETLNFYVTNLKKVITERQKSAEEFKDFVALMLNSNKESVETGSDQLTNVNLKPLSVEEILAQCLNFLFAGYDGSSIVLTYIVYFLAKNQKAQDEIYNELLNYFGTEEKISYESLSNLPLLDGAINESFRLCPVVLRLERKCSQNVTLTASDGSEIFAKKGDIFMVPVYPIHMDPLIWPNPETFDIHRETYGEYRVRSLIEGLVFPSRLTRSPNDHLLRGCLKFDSENKKLHSTVSFLPFGAGPRNCVGLRFAMLMFRWALVILLRHFKVVTCEETMESIKFLKSEFLVPQNPIILKIVKRD